MKIQTRTIGPDRFCPDCGRWLVRVHENGTFDLASMAGANFTGTSNFDIHDLPKSTEIEIISVEARCLHRKCRIKHWWKDGRWTKKKSKRSLSVPQ